MMLTLAWVLLIVGIIAGFGFRGLFYVLWYMGWGVLFVAGITLLLS